MALQKSEIVVDARSLRAAIAGKRPGLWTVYFRGDLASRAAVEAKARDLRDVALSLAEAGVAVVAQRRIDTGRFEYLISRTRNTGRVEHDQD
jgi:hypothetical protein